MTDSKSIPTTPGKKGTGTCNLYGNNCYFKVSKYIKKEINESAWKVPEREISHDLDILKRGFTLWRIHGSFVFAT